MSLPRRKVVSQPIVSSFRGLPVVRRITAAVAAARLGPQGPYGFLPANEDSPRVLSAEALHNDERAFWRQRRSFYVRRNRDVYVPTWDRCAQALLLMSRSVARVPQEAAFRLFAVFLKMMLTARLADLSSVLLPVWLSHNVAPLLEEAKRNAKEGPTGAAAAEAGTPAPAAVAEPPATPPAGTA